MRVMTYVQAGEIPAALRLYGIRVRTGLGDDDMFNALTYRRSSLSGQRFHVRDSTSTPQGRVVVITADGTDGHANYVFVVAEAGGSRGRVQHDSLLADALGELAAIRVRRELASRGVAEPRREARAQAASSSVVRRYNQIFSARS